MVNFRVSLSDNLSFDIRGQEVGKILNLFILAWMSRVRLKAALGLYNSVVI
jgi:hypothetical protein